MFRNSRSIPNSVFDIRILFHGVRHDTIPPVRTYILPGSLERIR